MWLFLDLETKFDKDVYPIWKEDMIKEGKGSEEELLWSPPIAWEIICLGWGVIDNDYKVQHFGTGRTDEESEYNILKSFNGYMNKHRNALDIVTWKGRVFDLPILVYRSMYYGLSMPWYFQDLKYTYRFSPEGHLDLADFICNYNASKTPRSNYINKLIGMPGKVGVDGSNVAEMYKNGKMNEICSYCMTDVIQLFVLFLHTSLLRGIIDYDKFYEAVANLTDYVANYENIEDQAVRDGCKILLPGLNEYKNLIENGDRQT